jgi:hypothetical protein
MENDTMTSRPPPLPNQKSPPPIPKSTSSGLPTDDSDSNSLIYGISAFLVLLAILLLIFAIRMHMAANGGSNGKDSSDIDAAGQVQSGHLDAEGSDGEKAQASQQESTQSESDTATQSFEETETTPKPKEPLEFQDISESQESSQSSDENLEEPSASGEGTPDEDELEGLASIPIFVGGQSSAGPGIVGVQGNNPLLGALDSKSTVFVIDQSGSMSGDRLRRVIHSMKESIGRLEEEQEFLIVFFSDGVNIHPQLRSLAPASEKNKQIAMRWLDTISAGGGTSPEKAMLHAIQQKPKRIILLSDGEFNPLEVEIITDANQRPRIRIDGIGLAEQVQTLQDLAKRNRGIYFQAN